VVVRKSVLNNVGPFDEEMQNSDDCDMWFRIARAGFSFAFIDLQLHSYRVTQGGVTARGWRRYPSVIRGLEKQIPYVHSGNDKKNLFRRISENYLGLGWGKRSDGDYSGAQEAYNNSLAYRCSLAGVGGMIRTWVAIKVSD